MSAAKPLPPINVCTFCNRERAVVAGMAYGPLKWGDCGNCRAQGPTKRSVRGAIMAWNRAAFNARRNPT